MPDDGPPYIFFCILGRTGVRCSLRVARGGGTPNGEPILQSSTVAYDSVYCWRTDGSAEWEDRAAAVDPQTASCPRSGYFW